MTGLVVVAHSRALADAAVALAREMVPPDRPLRLAVAAGTADGGTGTDATSVAAAIEAVAGPDGVLVLLDLGSAVLTAELALELVPAETADRVRLSAAPLVEGLVAAVVSAAGGADLATVAAEAERGLAAKQTHLGESGAPAPAAGEPEPGAGPTYAAEITLTDPHGLHARPAARLAAVAAAFPAALRVSNLDRGTGPVDARSLSAVATLDARQGDRLRVTATGDRAEEALAALTRLAAAGFTDGEPPHRGPAGPDAGTGLDLALGPALVPRAPDRTGYRPGSVAEETKRSDRARAAVRRRLTRPAAVRDEAAAVLAAQAALLDDPEVIAAVGADLAAGTSAVDAWQCRLDAVAERFAALADPYQRERATDVRSVRSAVLRALTGTPEDAPAPGAPHILVVEELDVATAASADPARVAGIVVAARGRTGHGVIVAGSRGIPLFLGAGAAVREIADGRLVAFDARRGRLWTTVSREQAEGWPAYAAERAAEQAALVEAARSPAVTRDGAPVPVLANLGSLADAEVAARHGADGAGLVRTEVLFAGWAAAPTRAEQAERLRRLAARLDGRPLTVRTWDVGGDKPLPFLPLPREANPFLGVRGVRAFLGDRAPLPATLLDDQLAAVADVAPVAVMFPMVTTRAEVTAALARLDRALGGRRPDGLRVGIMVETPAAALAVGTLAAGLDFVSLGTNDLAGYVAAADRGSDAVADLADPLAPALLRLVDLVVRERPDGVAVAVCGDLASRPEAVPLLLGLGVEELSCAPPLVPEVKAAVRRTDRTGARALAAAALRAADADGVRALLRSGAADPG